VYSADRLVLSSTNFDGTRPFHEIVSGAKEKGFTEPDPRIDLSGKDVGRKILILARETGVPMETEHIELKGFLPVGAMEAESVDDFFSLLEKNADYFTKLHTDASAEGKVLRMIATLEGDQASVGVQAVGPENPFHGLSGSDNMVVFTNGPLQRTAFGSARAGGWGRSNCRRCLR